MTLEELKQEVYTAMQDKPEKWRKGQFVFNYIDGKYWVADTVHFQDGVDCYCNDDMIDAFLACAVKHINTKTKC